MCITVICNKCLLELWMALKACSDGLLRLCIYFGIYLKACKQDLHPRILKLL